MDKNYEIIILLVAGAAIGIIFHRLYLKTGWSFKKVFDKLLLKRLSVSNVSIYDGKGQMVPLGKKRSFITDMDCFLAMDVVIKNRGNTATQYNYEGYLESHNKINDYSPTSNRIILFNKFFADTFNPPYKVGNHNFYISEKIQNDRTAFTISPFIYPPHDIDTSKETVNPEKDKGLIRPTPIKANTKNHDIILLKFDYPGLYYFDIIIKYNRFEKDYTEKLSIKIKVL